MIIPQKVQNKADALGWCGVEYVGAIYGSLVFQESCAGVDPVGLPNVLIMDGDDVFEIIGAQALTLLSLLDHS